VTEAAKLDLAMIFGTGFPPFRGGLLRHADAIGLDRVFTRLDDLAERLGPRFAPADLIQSLANARRGFYPDSPTSSREISA
jgi:3-hydroxyacyl-CoA dehydrogenase